MKRNLPDDRFESYVIGNVVIRFDISIRGKINRLIVDVVCTVPGGILRSIRGGLSIQSDLISSFGMAPKHLRIRRTRGRFLEEIVHVRIAGAFLVTQIGQ
ncbi:hypothetical protein [Symmachiella macrocystis]|uniref:hypothetical protein n=1 Tax=Symmachiella macrocystis TaxID=2527985 RepID=UPI0018D3C8F3|nr:hypothetical protein [Symmachiella macrocystis]